MLSVSGLRPMPLSGKEMRNAVVIFPLRSHVQPAVSAARECDAAWSEQLARQPHLSPGSQEHPPVPGGGWTWGLRAQEAVWGGWEAGHSGSQGVVDRS